MAQRLNEIAVGEFGVGVVEDGKTTEKVDVDDIDVDDDVEVEFADLLAEARLDAVEETAEAEPSTSGRAAAPPAPAKRAPAAAPARRGRKPKKEIPVDMLPKVAVVGRPNVGKSALFNRFAGSRLAIVYDQPGVTRDRMYARAHWGGRDYLLIDTGGLMAQAAQLPAEIKLEAMKVISAEGLPSAIERQAAAGISEADAVVMVVDGQEGPNAMESEIIEWLRRVHGGKPVVLAVNKCESPQHGAIQAAAFWEYGLEPFAVSAISGSGTGELLDRLIEVLPREKSREEVEVQDSVAVALVGRPNVGKSSLLNALTGENRAIISSMSGTTRDAVDTDITTPDGEHIKLIDTAGVRKRAAVASSSDGAEPLSVNRALRAMRRADVVVHVIDASIGVSQQDYRLAELVAVEGRACVLVVNKWDVIPDKTDRTLREWQENALAELRPVEWASVVFTSAVTGQRVKNVLKAALVAANEHKRRVSTATLNLVLSDATAWRLPPSSSGSSRKARIYYTTQVGVQPPTFVFFCNDARLITDDYKRYMERQIRENCGFGGTPLRLFWRSKDRIDDGERAVEVR